MVASGTGECLCWLYSVLLLLLAAQTCKQQIQCASFQPLLRSQHNISRLVFTLQSALAITILNCSGFSASPSLSTHPPNEKTSLLLPHTTNQPIFYKLFGGNFYEQQLVLGKLLSTVKWSTFSLRAHNPWLHGYSALKSLKSIIVRWLNKIIADKSTGIFGTQPLQGMYILINIRRGTHKN